MVTGILILDRLAYIYISALPTPSDADSCNILNSQLCGQLLKDPFTILLILWTSLQLVWVTMLLAVQFVQIARAKTTYESMKSHTHYHDHDTTPAPNPLTTALTTGTTDPETAGLTSSGAGPNPIIAPPGTNSTTTAAGGGPKHKDSCFAQWSKLLGLDTFFTVAFQGYHGSQAAHAHARQRRGNPFSRGIWTNCVDFWRDVGPVVGRKESGMAKLGGETVNYARLFEVPAMTTGGRRRRGGYEAVGEEEA